ncbi:DUF6803 family protein [Anaerovibrio sp.]|uniref:DUF6803 family protein n=1 Tax=Anaerovibrio sp. TaxID=1872532 RepID=UPI0025C25116|nr:DUF6803 family protein [Anaerovibrio sp.]MBR2141816.1 cytochrome oxidase biogenesis protein Surf12C [Anaerovibrio sp.]
MTNYMELLMTNQPWNLILFMVIPVGLAEFLVATEFYTLYLKDTGENLWKSINTWLGKITGIYFTGVFIYLITYVVPNIEWRGWVDVVAVGAYLCGIVPLLGITLLEFGIVKRNASSKERTKSHFMLLIGFLIVSHVAMIFGMVDPTINDLRPVAQQEMPMHSHDHSDGSGHAGHSHE